MVTKEVTVTAHVPLAAGRRHTVGRLADGRVVAVGSDSAGECQVAQWRDIVAVTSGNVHIAGNTGRSHTLGLRGDGTVLASGWNSQGQCNVRDWRNVIAIAAGWRFSAGLRGDGTLVTVGRGNGRSTAGARSRASAAVTGTR